MQKNNFTLHIPINSLSFGQISVNILKELFKRGYEPNVFPIGQVQLNAYAGVIPDGFTPWLQKCIHKAPREHRKEIPTFKLWHLQDSIASLSNKQILLTFHETDRLTEVEKNVCKNNDLILVTSEYNKNVFQSSGIGNVEAIPLGFDSDSFKVTNKKYHPDGVIFFGLAGKAEMRKRTLDVLRLWAQKYGNNRQYALNCSIFNHFLPPQQQEQLIFQALEGKKYWNIFFNPFAETNLAYNDFLNSNDIIIAASVSEAWGLPEFQSVALGKHALTLNAHGYRDWANAENSALFEPSGKREAFDGIFFGKGGDYNQGNFFDWQPESFHKAMDSAILRYHSSKVNVAGLKLQEQFTYSAMVDKVLNYISSI